MGYREPVAKVVEKRRWKRFRILHIGVGEWWRRILRPLMGKPGPGTPAAADARPGPKAKPASRPFRAT